MKNIGIIFAMEEELNEFLKLIKESNKNTIYDILVYEVDFCDKRLYLALSGVGKVNSARCTQILIDKYPLDLIINIGVAGGVSSLLNIGDIVIADRLVQHDFDITAFNHKKGYIPNVGDHIKVDDNLLRCSLSIAKEKEINYHVGTIASGDIFCTEESMSKKINDKFNALCVEMESASVAQVAYLCHVPYLIIRSISDVPGKENVTTYEEFLISSSKKVSKYALSLVEKL